MKRLFLLLSLLVIKIYIAPADIISQWSSNPSVNLQVCDVSGEQVLPKIANTSDGGTYICWFDNRNGNYAVYLQRLNAMGEKQFATDGLLISGTNSQSSSLVDWDMISDDSDNAVIVFTDTRNGADINPFAYRISPQGNFLWGANGITLAGDPNTFQANPKVIKTSDNNFVITWIYSSTPNKIAFQKISGGGVKQWGADPIYFSGAGAENYTYPSLVTSDNGSVIALWSGYTGSFLNPGNYKLYTEKISPSGTSLWNDIVYSLGNVTGFFVPKIFSDGNNGAIYVWQDDRNSANVQSSFVQRYSSSGTRLFPANGSEGSTAAGMNKFDAWAAYMPATGETYIVWKQSNSLQSSFAIYGQRFSPSGSRLWTDDAKQFVAFSNNSYINQICFTKDTSFIAAYNESVFGSADNFQFAFMSSRSGDLRWGGSVKDMGNIVSGKSKVVGMIDQNGMTKIAWSDNRTGADGIYAQNINFNGTLGNLTGINNNTGQIPGSFSLLQNFPNPFNPKTIISYQLTKINFVTLKVYDILGNEAATIVNQKQNAGTYQAEFDGSNLSSGIYFYTLNAGEFSETKSMILLK